jgi:hypothetical protein
MDTLQADIPREIQVGKITLTLVHPDRVRIWDAWMMEAVTVDVDDMEKALRLVMDSR